MTKCLGKKPPYDRDELAFKAEYENMLEHYRQALLEAADMLWKESTLGMPRNSMRAISEKLRISAGEEAEK